MKVTYLFLLITAPVSSVIQSMEMSNTDQLRMLINRAAHERAPVDWAMDLLEADRVAERLEMESPSGCCGYRCIRVGSFELHFRYNSIEGKEDYQHALLQTVAMAHGGEPEGTEALIRLLPTGCQTIGSQWTPYFKTVIGIVDFAPWNGVKDPRLIKIKAEAYETWWSLSKNDPMIADQGLKAADFQKGAATARQEAIAAYRELVMLGKADTDIRERLRKLTLGQDTKQYKWFCAGD